MTGRLSWHRLGATARRETWLDAVWVGIVAAISGLWHIGRPEMWQDELVTIAVAGRSKDQIFWLLTKVDAVHGEYYLFMHGWSRVFGDSPTAIRFPSAVAMAGAAACVTLTGHRLFGRAAGILGGLTFLVIPSIARFAQEARSYAFVVLCASLATLLLIRACDRPTVLRWTGYGLCVAVLANLNLVAATIVAAHAIAIMFWSARWRLLIRFVVASVAGVLTAVPVIRAGTAQANQQVQWIPHESPVLVWSKTFASTWLAVVVTGLAILACARYRQWQHGAAVVAVVAVVPMLVIWLASLGELSYFFSKYLLFVLPAWAVLAGAGLASLPWKATPVVGLVLMVAAAAPGQLAMRGQFSHSWYTYPAARSMTPLAYSKAADTIAEHYRPGDGVVYLRAQYWWYMTDAGVTYYLPPSVKLRDVFRARTPVYLDVRVAECTAGIYCIGNEPRLWIVEPVETDDPLAYLSPDYRRLLMQHYSLAGTTAVSGITVGLVVRTS